MRLLFGMQRQLIGLKLCHQPVGRVLHLLIVDLPLEQTVMGNRFLHPIALAAHAGAPHIGRERDVSQAPMPLRFESAIATQ
jgi:hypothetical protein